MKDKKLYLFDLDGTLIDSKEDIADSVNITLEKIGMATVSYEKIYSYIGLGVTPLFRDLLKSEEELEETLKVFRDIYLDNLLNKTGYYDGMFAILTELKQKGKLLGVATNKPMVYAEKIAHGLKFHELFDVVLGADSTPKSKPDPGMIYKAMEDTGCTAEESLLIGDGVNDILAAQNAGITSVSIGFGMGIKQYLLHYHPDYYCETIQELRELIL